MGFLGLISETLVFICAAWLAWRGYQHGVIRTLQRFVALLCAYAACYFFMAPLAKIIQSLSGWQMIPSWLASGLICFLIVAILVEKIISTIADNVEGRGIEPAKIPGAITGGVLGGVLGIVLAWLLGILLDGWILQRFPQTKLPEQDRIRTVAGNVIGGVVERTMVQVPEQENLMPELTSQLLANPVSLTQQVMNLSQGEAMRNLFSDPVAQQLMLAQETAALQENVHFQTLMTMPEAMEILTLLGEKTAMDQDMHQQEKVARLLSNMYQKVSRVQHDPRFLKLVEKPEFKQLAQNPSPIAMLANPALSELAEIIFDPALPSATVSAVAEPTFQRLEPLEWEAATTIEPEVAPEEEIPAPEELVMYRWTDANGRKHYSETRPEEDYEVEVVRLSP